MKKKETKGGGILPILIVIESILVLGLSAFFVFRMINMDRLKITQGTAQSAAAETRSTSAEKSTGKDSSEKSDPDKQPTKKNTPTPTLTPKPTSTPKPTKTPTPVPDIIPLSVDLLGPTDGIPTNRKVDFEQVKEPNLKRLVFSDASASSYKKGGNLLGSKYVSVSGWNAIDFDSDTSWQEGNEYGDGSGAGEWLTLGFSSPQNVKVLHFYLGNWRVVTDPNTDYYENNNSPRKMTILINSQKYSVNFVRDKVMQRVEFETIIRTNEIKFLIDSAYDGEDTDDDCCISEIVAYGTN